MRLSEVWLGLRREQHAHSVGEREAEHLAKDLPFLARPGTWRVQINLIPVPAAQAHSLRSRLPHLPINTVLGDHPDDSSRDVEAAQKLDDQTFALLKSLCNTARQAAERSLHSAPVSAQV